MRAIMVSQFGGPEVLQVREIAMPQPRSGEVLVRVLAAGAGPWDVSLRGGGWTGPLPYIPGGEFAGVVEGHSVTKPAFTTGRPCTATRAFPGAVPNT
jgi:NADPH:quinone reductase-like Zn-dependent oxidoreductase